MEALGNDHPEIGNAWYNLAAVEAVQRKRGAALADLNKAIDHGYNDTEDIGHDSNWDAFRNDAEYQRAIARMATQKSKR
jgi:tetratricopeptide (TPR) repeat protein